MIHTNKRLYICITLLIANLCFIWGNSLLPGHISAAFSDWVRHVVGILFPGTAAIPGGSGLLRKLAHFTEFACLGVCLRWLFGMLRSKPWEHWLFPLGTGVVTACIDETIQIFVPDRGPGIRDVCIDSLGVMLGITLLSLIHIFKNKKNHLEDKIV